jgi:segregation and condensation protein B
MNDNEHDKKEEDIEETEAGPDGEGGAGADENELRGLFEAVLFLSSEPLPVAFFVKHFGLDPVHARIVMDSLVDEYESRDGGIRIVEISKGFQFVTHKRHADQIRRVMGYSRKETLSKGMLETLSIISYKQPISIAEIDELRGVSSRMMVSNLMKKNLVRPVGRKDLPGRPLAYGTTNDFLKFFGLNRISDLPKLSEIKELTFTSEE